MAETTTHLDSVDGVQVGWIETGDPDAPPVVLVHGLGASGQWWARTLPSLRTRMRARVVDLTGFGRSRGQAFRLDRAAETLASWADRIGLARAAWVGHSLGGMVVADLAARRPDLVERLVLVDAAGLPVSKRVLPHLLHVIRGGRHLPIRVYPIALAGVLLSGPLTIARAGHQILASDLRERLRRIAAPTLVIWGSEDRLLPPEVGDRLAATIPRARLEVIEGAGHSPMWERPTEFERTLVGFLEHPIGDRSDDPTPLPDDPAVAVVTRPTGGRVVSRYLAVGDWSIHVRVGRPAGEVSSPPIVFVHGYVISSRYHVPTMERLAGRHLVLAPDMPGFGWSTKPDEVLDVPGLANAIVATLDAAGIDQAVLVGNSLGSQVAAQVAADHPDRVLAAVLTGPTFDPSEPRLLGHVLRLIADIPMERPSLWFKHIPDYILTGVPRAIATLRHAWRHKIETVLPRIEAPVVVVRGGRDPLAPRAWVRRAARLAPRGRALEVVGGGHAVNHSSPGALTQIIEDVVAAAPRR
jgi:2-hydroxy-6-oxonona-2,4-dienedioate hydrolase